MILGGREFELWAEVWPRRRQDKPRWGEDDPRWRQKPTSWCQVGARMKRHGASWGVLDRLGGAFGGPTSSETPTNLRPRATGRSTPSSGANPLGLPGFRPFVTFSSLLPCLRLACPSLCFCATFRHITSHSDTIFAHFRTHRCTSLP